jgi:hypothetical protein
MLFFLLRYPTAEVGSEKRFPYNVLIGTGKAFIFGCYSRRSENVDALRQALYVLVVFTMRFFFLEMLAPLS